MTVVVGKKDPMMVGVKALESVMSNLNAVYIDGEDHMTIISNKEYLKTIEDHVGAHSLVTVPTS